MVDDYMSLGIGSREYAGAALPSVALDSKVLDTVILNRAMVFGLMADMVESAEDLLWRRIIACCQEATHSETKSGSAWNCIWATEDGVVCIAAERTAAWFEAD